LAGVASAHAVAGPHVCLVVRDTGPGIAPQLAQKIFEPFYTTKTEGTGLGLAAVAGVVRELRGWLTVANVAAGASGAEFQVYLPTYEAPIAAQDAEQVAAMSANAPAQVAPHAAIENPVPALAAKTSTRTALVVDDEPSVRDYLEKVLRARGWSVSVAQDGKAAKALLTSAPVDLLVTDLTMPRMGGFELIDWLSRVPPCPAIVVMSGYSADRERLMACHGSLVHAWLDKPFNLTTFQAAIGGLEAAAYSR
jgi:two-component system, cell cycle sensor histidine kinase and response regulator CckA